MKAKCPTCESGCDKCVDGFREVQLAEGLWHTRACTSPECLFENGVRISKEPLQGPSGPCIACGAPTEWLAVESTPPERGYPLRLVEG